MLESKIFTMIRGLLKFSRRREAVTVDKPYLQARASPLELLTTSRLKYLLRVTWVTTLGAGLFTAFVAPMAVHFVGVLAYLSALLTFVVFPTRTLLHVGSALILAYAAAWTLAAPWGAPATTLLSAAIGISAAYAPLFARPLTTRQNTPRVRFTPRSNTSRLFNRPGDSGSPKSNPVAETAAIPLASFVLVADASIHDPASRQTRPVT